MVIYDQLTACLKKMSVLTTPLLLVKKYISTLHNYSRFISKWSEKGLGELWNAHFRLGKERDGLLINSLILLRKFFRWDWFRVGQLITICPPLCCNAVIDF